MPLQKRAEEAIRRCRYEPAHCPSNEESPQPVMPAAVVQLQSEPTREDSASNTRNIKMLQTLSKQVCEYACTSKQITVSLK